jgi:myo-inositol-1(or 4)-monophosphatase
MSDPTDLLGPVIDAARAAGEKIEAVRRRGIIAREKTAGHPVTAADREADTLLRERLLALLPCGWLSEETVDSPVRRAYSRCWIVDPLDGTKEFIAGIAEYAVSVALVQEGRPILAVIARPAADAVYHAILGGGAHRGGRVLHVREGRTLLASRTEVNNREFAPFEDAWRIEPSGSIALKLAHVAAGEASLTLSRGRKGEWDVCAGVLLVEEAGGVASDAEGRSFAFNGESGYVRGVIAGAPDAWSEGVARTRQLPPLPPSRT